MKTVMLDPEKWDLVLDNSGNIAVCDDPYSQAQDAASAIKTFKGECYYDVTLGVPYFQQILGKFPPAGLLKSYFVKAALSVPGVIKARCILISLDKRTLRGEVQVTTSSGLRSFLGF